MPTRMPRLRCRVLPRRRQGIFERGPLRRRIRRRLISAARVRRLERADAAWAALRQELATPLRLAVNPGGTNERLIRELERAAGALGFAAACQAPAAPCALAHCALSACTPRTLPLGGLGPVGAAGLRLPGGRLSC